MKILRVALVLSFLSITIPEARAQSNTGGAGPAGLPSSPTSRSTTPSPRDEAMLRELLGRDAANRLFRERDGTVIGLAGDLADPATGELEALAREFVAARGGALGIPPGVRLERSDLQDGTPVRVVRFRPHESGASMPAGEVQVTYDRGGRVIGFTVGPAFALPAGPVHFPLPVPVPGPTVPPTSSTPGPVPSPAPGPEPKPAPTWTPRLPGPAEFPFLREPGSGTVSPPRLTEALREIGRNARLASDARAERIWVLNERGEAGLRTRVEVSTEQPGGSWELIFRTDGSLERRTEAQRGTTGTVYAEFPELRASNRELLNLESTTQLDGRWVHTLQGDNPRARPTGGNYHFTPEPPDPRGVARRMNIRLFDPDFLEVNAYYHVNRTHELMRGYGCEFADFPIEVDVLDATGSENACYRPSSRSLHFFSLSRFHPAADNSVVCHEYGHALFHALQRESSYASESAAVNEGFADFVAGLVTGSQLIGAHHFTTRPGARPRDMANGFTYADRENQGPHALGQVWAGLGWDLKRELGVDGARTLMFGAIQLAPRPTDYKAACIGLVLADRFFNNGRNADLLRRQLARRGLDL